MKGQEHIGIGLGFLYEVEPNGTTIRNFVDNNKYGLFSIRNTGISSAPLAGNISAVGSITVTAVVDNKNVTAITINGVNQIGANVDSGAGATTSTMATSVRDAINSFKPSSGPDYTATVKANVLAVIAPANQGSAVNGLSITFTTDDPGITADTVDIGGGSEGEKAYDPIHGTRFFVNAHYNAQGQLGEGTASETSLTNAVEITELISLKGLQSKFDSPNEVITDDRIDTTRTMALMNITVDTENQDATDDLIFISTENFTKNDWIVLTGKVSGRVVTVKEDANGNINLLDNSSFVTGDKTRSIVLRYDQTDNDWNELFRTDIPVIDITYLRSKGVNLAKSGTLKTALTTGGGTKSLTPGTSVRYQIYTGTGTLSSSWTIEGAGSPKDDDEFYINYQGIFTPDGNNITIFGISLTDKQITNGNVLVHAVYNLANTTWNARLALDLSANNSIEKEMIPNDEITNAKLKGADPALTARKYLKANITVDVKGHVTEMEDGTPSDILTILTHASAVTKRTNSTLIQGTFYLLSDKNLIVYATKIDEFSKTFIIDIENRQDVVHYDFVTDTILFRHDVVKNLSAWFDWRTVTFEIWETTPGSNIYTEFTDPSGGNEGSQQFYAFGNAITDLLAGNQTPAANGNGGTCVNIHIEKLGSATNKIVIGNAVSDVDVGSNSGYLMIANSCNRVTIGKNIMAFLIKQNSDDFRIDEHFSNYKDIIAISSGVISMGTSLTKYVGIITMDPESGTTDDLDDITSPPNFPVKLLAASGDTITIKHDVAKISTASKLDILIDVNNEVDFRYGSGAGSWLQQSTKSLFTETEITANPGGGQGSAVLLTKDINIVNTVGSSADSVKLPSAEANTEKFIRNAGANSMNLFPNTGDRINNGSTDAAISIAASSSVLLKCSSNLDWYSIS